MNLAWTLDDTEEPVTVLRAANRRFGDQLNRRCGTAHPNRTRKCENYDFIVAEGGKPMYQGRC